jgi:hypothetical protein
MGDRYDKVITTLGLDGHRTDVLFGTVEQEVIGLEALQAGELRRVSRNRLPDGRRLLLFQFGPYPEGSLWPMPCSSANAEAVGGFLDRARSYLPAADMPDGSSKSVLGGVREWLRRARPVERMTSLPHCHFDARIELKLLADQRGNHILESVGRARGGCYRHRWGWSHAAAGAWQRILAALREKLTEWPAASEKHHTQRVETPPPHPNTADALPKPRIV